MLTRAHRLTSGKSFGDTVRRGRRAGSRTVAVHLVVPPLTPAPPRAEDEPKVGFVVSKAVGSAVVRNRVKRRLRHQVAPHVSALPPGTSLVLRALPPAATHDSTEIAEELRAGLTRCLSRTMVTS